MAGKLYVTLFADDHVDFAVEDAGEEAPSSVYLTARDRHSGILLLQIGLSSREDARRLALVAGGAHKRVSQLEHQEKVGRQEGTGHE